MKTAFIRRTSFMLLLVILLVIESKAEESSNATSVNYHVSANRNATGHWLMNAYVTRDSVRESRPYIDFDVQVNEGFTPTQRMTVVATLAWNSAITSVLALPQGYEHFPGLGYYKFHTKAENWEAARLSCQAEGAHLIVINWGREAGVVKAFLDRNPKLTGALDSNWYYVGFNDKDKKGDYVTVLGGLLSESGYTEGYSNWPPGKCGVINKELQYTHGTCQNSRAYVCEWRY